MNNEENLSNDGRIKGEYKTRYEDKRCRIKIIRDAIYITFLMILALVCVFLNFLGVFEDFLGVQGDQKIVFHKVIYCVSSGLLGGSTFGMKYFYRVVARGLWNEDRVYWRFFSPFIAVSLSLVMAAIMVKAVLSSSSMAISIGFLTGYFSDEAVSKMYDVACVLFLKSDNGVNNRDSINDKIDEDIKEDHDDLDSKKR
ncbi:MAG TPA: hypothetical protein H9776_10230 [Candidatus Mediterraneibacter intestinipullorum]|nr:hypothetical protein [Candidatus Mediterraneibacter intestinipullorum]